MNNQYKNKKHILFKNINKLSKIYNNKLERKMKFYKNFKNKQKIMIKVMLQYKDI